MIKAKVIRFLKPDWKQIAVFVIFVLIAFGGKTQAWVFVAGAELFPEPPLYDLLRPLPLWPIMIWLLWPLLLLSGQFFVITSYDADFPTAFLSWFILIIYFYALSYLISFIGGKFISLTHLLIGEKL